jgi:23S rRNA (cytosine1962-C5)-methyltransferase
MKKYFGPTKPRVILKKGKAKPFWHHHPWVFSGAVRDVKGNPANGDVVEVLDEANRFIGKGFIALHSQILVRLLTWDLHEKINTDFFCRKIRQAIYLRDVVLAMRSKTSAYRLVHSEGDALPGLIVDRYNQFLVVQFLSVGMDRWREVILNILKEETQAASIVERYQGGYRTREGLEEIEYAVHGTEPPEKIEISEYGLKFFVNLQRGQKTGFYLDQRENRLQASRYGYQKKALDAFCYSGGFGIYLLAKGKASEVVFMDSSAFALELAQENIQSNSVREGKFSFCKADIFEKLPEFKASGEKFDIIILDPPKVAPDQGSLKAGLTALQTLNSTAAQILVPQGILITCDCSGLIGGDEFTRVVNKAVIDAGRNLRILELKGAGPDHPINPACLENAYLKVVVGIVE